jgi:hypothetical protein
VKISELLQPHMTESAHVHTDNVHGWGAVPDNQNVDYLGLRVHMTPSQFLKLAAPLAPGEAASAHAILDHLKLGGKVGSPFLTIRIPESWERGDFSQPAKVVSHEGRNRMMALQHMQGDSPVETHLFFSGGLRARHIQPEWIPQLNTHLIPQKGSHAIPGPFFDRIMQEQTTRTSKSGAPGTLKAKIKRVYGDTKVTCANTQKLKTRPRATAHDKAQANWFQNMHDCASHIHEVMDSRASEKLTWTRSSDTWVTEFSFDDHVVKIEITSVGPHRLWVEFKVDGFQHITGRLGNRSAQLLGQVVNAVYDHLTSHNEWRTVVFSGAPSEQSRNRLYAALIQRIAARLPGVKAEQSGHKFKLIKTQPVTEIFQEPAIHAEWTPYGEHSFVTRFPFEDQRVWIEMYQYQDNSEIEHEFGSQLPDPLPEQAMGWNVIFRVGHATHVTSAWGAQSVKLLVKVVQVIRGFLEKHEWDYVTFVGESGSRNKLYAALAHRLAEQTHAHVIQQGDAFLVHKFNLAEDAAGVGLVVPGVNMPAGQHPDEIRRQARKFGFKTSAQGVPPVSRTDGKF